MLRELRPKIKQDPSNVELRFKLAEAHVDHDEWKSALAELDRIEKLAPGKHPLGYLRGRSLALAKRWAEAKQELDGFITAFPNHEEAHMWRARVRIELGDKEGASEDYRNACRTSRNPECITEFAGVLNGQDRAKESVSILQDALGRIPNDPALLECLVNSAIKAGDGALALSSMAALQKSWPRPEIWMRRKAAYLAESGRKAESEDAWRTLRDHILALPNLERSQPFLTEMLAEAQKALGENVPKPVIAPPAGG